MEQILKRYGSIIKGYDVDYDDKPYYYIWLKKTWVINGWQNPYPYDSIRGVKKECLELLKTAYKDEEVWKHLDDQQWLNTYAETHK